jgi:hypothetical protein
MAKRRHVMAGELAGREDRPQGAGDGVEVDAELEAIARGEAIAAMDGVITRIMQDLPQFDLTMPAGAEDGIDWEQESGAGEDELWGARTVSIWPDKQEAGGRRRYAFAAYDPSRMGVQSALMVDVITDEGPIVSNRYTVGEMDPERRPGVKQEMVDLETGDGSETWLDAAAIRRWVARLEAMEAEIQAGRYKVDQEGLREL